MTLQAWATIVGAGISATVAILIAIINKNGLVFWKEKRTISFSGSLYILRRFTGGKVHEVFDEPPLEQALRAAKLTIVGSKCALKSDYLFSRGGKLIVSGELTAAGFFHGRTAHLTYKIHERSTEHFWYGCMILYMPDWGNPFGYLITESVIEPGKTVLLFGDFTRI
jgi:hypothetical protein